MNTIQLNGTITETRRPIERQEEFFFMNWVDELICITLGVCALPEVECFGSHLRIPKERMRSGVYVLIGSSSLLYVGETSDLRTRVAAHRDRFEYEDCLFWNMPDSTKAQREAVEKAMIQRLCPTENRDHRYRRTGAMEPFLLKSTRGLHDGSQYEVFTVNWYAGPIRKRKTFETEELAGEFIEKLRRGEGETVA